MKNQGDRPGTDAGGRLGRGAARPAAFCGAAEQSGGLGLPLRAGPARAGPIRSRLQRVRQRGLRLFPGVTRDGPDPLPDAAAGGHPAAEGPAGRHPPAGGLLRAARPPGLPGADPAAAGRRGDGRALLHRVRGAQPVQGPRRQGTAGRILGRRRAGRAGSSRDGAGGRPRRPAELGLTIDNDFADWEAIPVLRSFADYSPKHLPAGADRRRAAGAARWSSPASGRRPAPGCSS